MHKAHDDGHFTVSIEVEIRPAVEADLPALEWLGLYSPHRPIMREALEAQRRGEALLLLGVSGNYPIAQVWIDFARKRQEGVALLWAIRTFFPLQGRGIGRRMMTAAERSICARGISRAELEVEIDNEGALAFYKRLGWRRAHEEISEFTTSDADGRPETRPVWVMEKTLTPPSH